MSNYIEIWRSGDVFRYNRYNVFEVSMTKEYLSDRYTVKITSSGGSIKEFRCDSRSEALEICNQFN